MNIGKYIIEYVKTNKLTFTISKEKYHEEVMSELNDKDGNKIMNRVEMLGWKVCIMLNTEMLYFRTVEGETDESKYYFINPVYTYRPKWFIESRYKEWWNGYESAQNQDELLDESRTVLQTIDDIAKGDIRTKIRDMLGAFLFRGETAVYLLFVPELDERKIDLVDAVRPLGSLPY